MENGDSRFVTKAQAKFHKVIAIISQTIGAMLLIGMGAAAMSDSGNINWNGAIWGILACVYLFVVGRWAYRAYKDGEATEKSKVQVVRWLNLLSFVFFLAVIAFLIGNIIDNDLYRKMGFNF